MNPFIIFFAIAAAFAVGFVIGAWASPVPWAAFRLGKLAAQRARDVAYVSADYGRWFDSFELVANGEPCHVCKSALEYGYPFGSGTVKRCLQCHAVKGKAAE